MPLEIERKFLVTDLPPSWQKQKCEKIAQGYLFNSAEGVVRVRQKGAQFFQTIKKRGNKIREEIEFKLNEDQFKNLWPHTSGQRVSKTRYYIPYHMYTIELDIFEEKLQGLIVAEVEFENEQNCDAFIPPDWFGKEVTEDSRYHNSSLASQGIPN